MLGSSLDSPSRSQLLAPEGKKLLQTSIYARSAVAVASGAEVLPRRIATLRIRACSDYGKTAVESHPVPRWSLQKVGSRAVKRESSSCIGSHRRSTSKSVTHSHVVVVNLCPVAGTGPINGCGLGDLPLQRMPTLNEDCRSSCLASRTSCLPKYGFRQRVGCRRESHRRWESD